MIEVRIPATTANIGPGFDCVGLALDLWNRFTLSLDADPGTVSVDTVGEGAETLPRDQRHLVAKTMIDETWPGMMPTDRGIRIACENQVPCASGLGSSSTAVLAGLIFASALAARAMHPDDPQAVVRSVQAPENLQRVLKRAIKLEGHGDNVAPALLGGLQLVVPNGDALVRSVPFAPTTVVVCVPSFNFLTSEARAVLPGEYSRADTLFNIGHALLVLQALRDGDESLLADSMADRIHEPYRMPLIPGAPDAKAAALDAGAIAVCLSGAGPGMLALAADRHEQIGVAMQQAFQSAGLTSRFWKLRAIEQGTQIGAA